MPNEVSIIVRVKNMASAGLASAVKSINGLGSSIAGGVGNALGGLKGFVLGLAGAGSAAGVFVKAVQKSFEFERYQNQFGILFGSMDKAKEHFKDLKTFADATPFDLAGIAATSRVMLSMSGGVLGMAESLQVVGDAAAAAGQPIQEVGMWTARAYGAIRNGQPFGEAAQRLQEMGILGGEARKKMEELQAAGGANIDVWKILTDEMEKSKGGMEKLAGTGEGLMSTLSDTWDGVLAAFGDRFQDIAKNKIKDLIEWLTKLKEDGTLEDWASKATTVMEGLGKVLWGLGKAFAAVYNGIATTAQVFGNMSTGMSLSQAIDATAVQQLDDEAAIKAKAKKTAETKAKAEAEATKAAETKKAQAAASGEKKKTAIEADMEKGMKGQHAAIVKAYEEAKKDIDAMNRDALDVKMKPFSFEFKEAGKESSEKGIKRLKDEMAKYKEQMDIRKEIQAGEKQINAFNDDVIEKDLNKVIEMETKRQDADKPALERAQNDRKMNVRERRAKEKADYKKAKDREYTEDELVDLRKRAEDKRIDDLTKEEKLALKEDDKFLSKAAKLSERARKGQRLSPDEKRLLNEAKREKNARADAQNLKIAEDQKKLLQEKRDKDQAADIQKIREKIDALLVLKDGG